MAATIGYSILAPFPGARFTQFSLLESGGGMAYPTVISRPRSANLTVGITNHEYAQVRYTVRADLVGLITRYNSTTNSNDTFETNRTALSWVNVTLVHGNNWSRSYSFSVRFTGLWKVQFFLFKDAQFSDPYRQLHLMLRVV
jgi:uncharacterized membrane protein